MTAQKRIKAVKIPDGVRLPSSPKELAQALFRSVDHKLASEMSDDEPWASSGLANRKGRGGK